MKLKQLSLFLENKPGNVRQVCRTLADAGINIETLTLADASQYGILRLLVKDWDRAKDVFEKCGIAAHISDVVAVAIDHQPGGLVKVLDVLDEVGLNIEYMYGFVRPTGNAIIVFRLSDESDTVIESIISKGVRIVSRKELFDA